MALFTVNWKPDRHQLRIFGTICLLIFGALGVWVLFRQGIFGFALTQRGAQKTAYGLWAAAGLCFGLGCVAPRALGPLYVILTAISLPIGYVTSYVVMAILFFGVVTPVGLVFRLVGRDPLDRRLDHAAETYWVPRVRVADVKRYYRQF